MERVENHRVRVRCPHCYALYSVQVEEISEERPKFECVSCTGRFWISYPDCLNHSSALLGFPIVNEDVAPKAPAPETAQDGSISKPFSCPKCTEPYAGGETECSRCGVVFEKFVTFDLKRNEISASPELREMWEETLNDYDNESLHERFVKYAQAEGNLEYALSKYDLLAEACPTDNIASRFRREARALLIAKTESRLPTIPDSPFNFRLPKFRIGSLIMVLCGIVIAMGLVVPGLRNLVGVGSSILFFILALRFYFRII